MKAVILAGGLGTRMREETVFKPKPMVEIGGKPVLWHIMKILSSQGIKEFFIRAGYKAEVIRNYFLNFRFLSLDSTITYDEEEELQFHGNMEEMGWSVTVADTGPTTNTGRRIKAVARYLDERRFLATYGDGIANVDITALVRSHENSGARVTMTTTSPVSRFGVVKTGKNGMVE